jgi:hypothetical protein
MATYALKEEDKNKRFSLAIQQMADKIFKSMSYSITEDLFEAAYNVEKTLQTLEKPSPLPKLAPTQPLNCVVGNVLIVVMLMSSVASVASLNFPTI